MKTPRTLALCLLAAAMTPLAATAKKATEPEAKDEDLRLAAATFAGLELRNIGPAMMSGRIADLAVHPEDASTWYVAVGSGNVWKTTNAGTTWTPIFDDQGSYSIGCITLDPGDPDVVWVGTGENVGGRHVGFGDGVYKSTDGGGSWTNMGLAASEHIGTIVVDPRDSDTVFVAAQGPLWAAGGERGLYKTTDGGATWERVLGGGEYTGVNEVIQHPGDPDTLIAATHQRHRTVAALIDGGPESGIHKSTDGGATWRELERGLPEEDMGKIGLAYSPQNPDVVYATIELAHGAGGFYRSTDGGESWEKRSDFVSGGTGPHYYQELIASPHAFDRVYQMNNRQSVTEDGGKTFFDLPQEHKHGDNHALAFSAADPEYLLAGTDGGIYESWDLGQTWKFVANLPLTQFYKVAVDYDEPFYHVVGGTQDNSTQYGPSRTDNDTGIRNSDWEITVFADGHQPAIDPTDPDIVYSEWQEGNLVRWDRRTGEIVYIQPQPEKGEEQERFNWDSPILVSPHDPRTIFFASQRVWKSDDRGDSWTPISGDLTHGRDRLELPLMDRVWSFDAIWDLSAMSKYGTITSLAQSPLDAALIYAGTDDGLIRATDDGGATWRTVADLPGVQEGFFVNDLKADLHDADTVYAAVDNHKVGDFEPYLLKSTDRGATWSSIRGDLPDRHLVWRVVQDHEKPELLFAGTEFGVFFTVDGGARWIELTGGVPTIPFRDLAIQRRENDLVGATFGRSFFVLDDYTPLRTVSEELLEREAALFPVRTAKWYVPRRPFGRGEKGSQGDAFFNAPNPPFGAVFTYYLRDSAKTEKQQRQEREKEIAAEGGDTPYPGWEALREEELEEEPAVVLTVRDAAGEVVRRVTGPAAAGFHRVAWDLRYPSPAPEGEEGGFFRREGGYLAPPGSYSVALALRSGGAETPLSASETFEVVPLRSRGLAGAAPAEMAAFLRELEAAERRAGGTRGVMEELAARLESMRAALTRSRAADASLDERAAALLGRVRELHETFDGNERRADFGDPGPATIAGRLGSVGLGNMFSTYGPTPMQRRQLAIASEELAELAAAVDEIAAVELPALEADLDAAGVPWSPGRGVPKP
ncbi:MAG: glycosyl hydrolase [Acidobacteriota bacterium]|nr:glycosyl hydrolase [Acidobacteriota bacterium]MDH3522327.1 glycosyl hydrolase [Acidobacteriota bacterium]